MYEELKRGGVEGPRAVEFIADCLGVTARMVYNYLKEVLEEERKEREERVRKLREEGKSIREISEELGVSESTVKRILKREGHFGNISKVTRAERAERWEAERGRGAGRGEDSGAPRSELERLRAEVSEWRGKYEELLEEKLELERAVGDLRGELETLRAENAELKSRVKELRSRAEDLEEDVEWLESRCKSLEREKERLGERIKSLEEELEKYRRYFKRFLALSAVRDRVVKTWRAKDEWVGTILDRIFEALLEAESEVEMQEAVNRVAEELRDKNSKARVQEEVERAFSEYYSLVP